MNSWMDDPAALALRLALLRLDHRALDDAISQMTSDRGVDDLQVRRLKKRKLQLKDSIAHLESELIPDLDA